MKFNDVEQNVKFRKKYDIVLTNGNSVVLLSVKHKVHLSDIDSFADEDVPAFKELFPQYSNYKIYGGIASLTMPDEIEELIEQKGLLALTQSGENPKLLNKAGFKARVF